MTRREYTGMRHGTATPLGHALEGLRAEVRAAASRGRRRLGSLRQLSRAAGVSQSTMQKAVGVLKQEGLITTSEGRGMRLLQLTPAQRTALDFLRARVARARSESVERLPTVVQLASEAGVSLATMAKAVQRAREAGIVRTAAGSGVYATGVRGETREKAEGPTAPPPPSTRPKWEQVAVAINGDMLSGRYRAGATLPSAKELCASYGVCGKTLGKALRDLLARRRLFRERTRYVVAMPEGVRHRNAVVLIARGTPRGELFRLNARTITHLRLLENECSRNGLRLLVAAHNDRRTVMLGPVHRSRSFAEALRRESVLGFVVWTMGITGEAFNLRALLGDIAQHRRPVAVLDEDEWWRPAALPAGAIKVFATGGGSAPGRAVGRFLLGLGHRSVAWFASEEWRTWAHPRLSGMREEFERAGLPHGVRVFEMPAGQVRGSQRRRTMEATSWDAYDYVSALRARRAEHGESPEAPTEQMLTRLRWQLSDFRREQELRRRLVPMLTQASRRTDMTVWAGANDEVALQCLDYLQLAGRKVPDSISVVGFDNSSESTIRGLTTYNLNAAAFMHAMISHVLDPRLDPWDPLRDPPVEIEGYVTERATTAPCRVSATPA